MKTQKLTPKMRKEIVARVAAGEKQKDLAAEFGVSAGLISRVMRQSKSSSRDPQQQRDLSDRTTEQLHNRWKECQREILEQSDQYRRNERACQSLQVQINNDTKLLESVSDAGYRSALQAGIRAHKTQLTYLTDTQSIAFALAKLHQEVSAICFELGKRSDAIPIEGALGSF